MFDTIKHMAEEVLDPGVYLRLLLAKLIASNYPTNMCVYIHRQMLLPVLVKEENISLP